MSSALDASMGIAAYLALFAAVGVLFLFVNLVVGRFLRPDNPEPEKKEIYECGEPTIGSSFVQFDLRFYVVALLFIIFDVEVAFFFPWATVFGKANTLSDPKLTVAEAGPAGDTTLSRPARQLYQELGVRNPTTPLTPPASLEFANAERLAGPQLTTEIVRQGSRQLALFSLIDIVVFFGTLLVGFAYVWARGDLDWVRAVSKQRSIRSDVVGDDAPESGGSAPTVRARTGSPSVLST